jgi:hypothetical protein
MVWMLMDLFLPLTPTPSARTEANAGRKPVNLMPPEVRLTKNPNLTAKYVSTILKCSAFWAKGVRAKFF